MQMKAVRHEGYSAGALEVLVRQAEITPAMLNGSANAITTVDNNTVIIDAFILIETPVGTPGATIDVGFDATFTGGPAEGDALFNGIAVDASDPHRLSHLTPSAANTLRGSNAAGGAITVTSAGDYTASDWEGELVILYTQLVGGN